MVLVKLDDIKEGLEFNYIRINDIIKNASIKSALNMYGFLTLASTYSD